MKYPRYSENEDRRRKLTNEQIDEIKELYNSGMSSRKIAAIYEVSKTIILYHCKSGIEKERVNNKRYELIKQQEKRNPSFKKLRQDSKRDFIKDKLRRSDEMKKYKGKVTYEWKKNKLKTDEEFKKKYNKKELERYHRNKKLINS